MRDEMGPSYVAACGSELIKQQHLSQSFCSPRGVVDKRYAL